jgi:NAD(P)-dependent dehydrogenase (short-subunit alcohol dehydrogenase family)
MSKRIVITGVTKGLGLAMTEEFIRRGHHVFGCGRSESAIDQLSHRFSNPHEFEVVDVTDNDAVAEWAESILSTGVPPDIVLNNAALINRSAPLWEVPETEFSDVIDVNIKGVTNVIRHLLPAMIEVGHGIIVNFSSGWGRSASAEVAPYCATKWAMEGLTQSLAQELPAGLAAIPLNPGIIHTEMLDSCFGREAATFPKPVEWAQRAVPSILGLGPEDNGQSLSVN